jgi:hypothetical protein
MSKVAKIVAKIAGVVALAAGVAAVIFPGGQILGVTLIKIAAIAGAVGAIPGTTSALLLLKPRGLAP